MTHPTPTVAARRASRAPEDAHRAPPPTEAPLFPAEAPPPPAAPALPATTLTDAHPGLCKPFSPRLIELKPGAVARDADRALAMPFVDLRSYFTRLDRVVGPAGWSHTYQLTARGVVCALTICGVTKSAIGDFPLDASDENPATSAEAQAFKRACAAFGLGRYLYSLPQVWADFDREKKRFVDPSRVVLQLYAHLNTSED